MNHLFKKLSVAVMIFTFVFLYAFSANQASAAVGSRSVEKSFVMDLTINMPGAGRETDVGTLTFKTTLPERVKPGEEFYLTNTSYTMTPKEADGVPYESIVYFKDLSFTVSSENETNSFKKCF